MLVLSVGYRPRPDCKMVDLCDKRKGREPETLTMTEGGLEKSGYVDVKQPQKLKGRKLKSWKKKWVVLQQMSNMSEGTYAAKIDVFPDEGSSYKSPCDKFTLFLENVTAVQPTKSKKHAHAFEIVENEAVFLMAGETELDSQTWIWTIRKIFWPHEFAETDGDKFTVAIVENAHTHRLCLKGVYLMTVTPETIAIHSDQNNSYEWSLNTLKRFNMEKDSTDGTSDVLAIECGPKSECGEAIFQFRSKAVLDILASIKKNIYLAISLKKAEKTPPCLPIKRLNPMDSPIRTLSHKGRDSVTDSITSITSSEQGIRDLLESPSKQAEKRIRMMSECSQATSDEETVPNIAKQVVNKTSIPEIIESSKDDSNVHGEMGVVRRTSIDILSEPIETNQNSAKKESDYYKIDFKAPATPSHETVPIISTITVARPGYQTNLLLDERGYSHVNLTSVKVQKDISKTRSLSNNSNRSSIRSASTGSKDSGIINQMPEKVQEKDIEIPTAHPSTNSFDSAVSTSSTVENLDSTFIDTKATKLSVEIEEVEVTVQCDSKDSELERSTENCIYQDVSFGDSKSEVTDSAARPKLKKSNSTGYFKTDENPYEELDKYRKGKKDLVKHLGMDPKVDPSSVPPSLPDRPLSHKMKRKFGSNADKKLFTLPFAKGKSRKNREKAMSSTSSDSDSESGGGGKKRDDLLSMKVWPLGDTSVAGSNDLYQPVAIERFLNDQDAVNEKITRERSCSLNLNRTPDMKRPSISSANVEMRGNKFRHHGRNASLTVELLGNDPNIEPLFPHKEKKEIKDMLKSDIHSPVSQVPSSLSPTDSFDYDSDSEDDSAMRCGHHDDEPVYAEVMPVGSRGGEGEVEEPFPNMDEWKPQNMSDFERNELDETNYENDESGAHSPVDLFNMGFVSKDENIEQNQATTGVLIDLDTEITDSDKKIRSLSAFDIFNATNNTSFMNQEVKALDSQPSRAEMNQALMDIFSLGAQTPLPQSSTDLWKTGTQYQTTRHEQSALLNGSTSGVSENWADFSRYTPVETRNNWADFSQFDSSQRDTGNTVTDSIYMDMSNYKNESIYVMPSEAKRQ